LGDDGGLGLEHSIEWTAIGLERVASVLRRAVPKGDWGREAWSAKFGPAETEIYSEYDESCAETVTTAAFLTVLQSWLDFISQPADKNARVQIEF
jgi:hypothetical protein